MSLYQLDLASLPKQLRDVLVSKLSDFSGLEKLNIGNGNVSIKSTFSSIRNFGRLTSLTYTQNCQNEALVVILCNCPVLRYLDISGSMKVTDQAVSSIGIQKI